MLKEGMFVDKVTKPEPTNLTEKPVDPRSTMAGEFTRTEMSELKSTKPTKKPVDPRSGMAIALTFFVISIFLYFQPNYFAAATVAVSLASIIIGFLGLGTELNRISSGVGNFADDF